VGLIVAPAIAGELRAVRSLDREEKAEYYLTVTAEDMGQVLLVALLLLLLLLLLLFPLLFLLLLLLLLIFLLLFLLLLSFSSGCAASRHRLCAGPTSGSE
jgi:uncharacterized membrane protein